MALMVRHLVALESVHGHFGAVVLFHPRARPTVETGSNDCHIIAVPHKTAGKSLSKLGGSVNVRCKGVAGYEDPNRLAHCYPSRSTAGEICSRQALQYIAMIPATP